jgi:uncharacterized protein YndB with AHSA1/START domain
MKIIKKEIVINAPVAKVWEHITDSKKIAGWFKPNTFEARVGAAFTIECHEEDGQVFGVVKEIVPLKKLVYTFQSKMIKIETLVTITLAPEGKSTRLTLIHSGWDALPPDQQNVSDEFESGWGGFLKNLQETARK